MLLAQLDSLRQKAIMPKGQNWLYGFMAFWRKL